MYAIIETGGKQIKVEKDAVIYVEKLEANEGDTVTFDKVLYADGNGCLPDLSAYDHYVVAVRLENLDLKDTEGMRYFCALWTGVL